MMLQGQISASCCGRLVNKKNTAIRAAVPVCTAVFPASFVAVWEYVRLRQLLEGGAAPRDDSVSKRCERRSFGVIAMPLFHCAGDSSWFEAQQSTSSGCALRASAFTLHQTLLEPGYSWFVQGARHGTPPGA